MSKIPKIGEIFDDKYEIEKILGSGGSGIVFKAAQLDCGRTIALKILLPRAATDEEDLGRFLREAQVLGKLAHANIVTVYHLGISSSKVPFLAMEYVNGRSIRAIIDEVERVPVLQSLKIARDAALALSYVHRQDIVHRDLKPENILITQLPDPDTVKIVDFGLIRLPSQQDQKLTGTGEILGTANYMSPEQCLGKAVDFRTDIYSLSSCLYEMIAGRAPFESATPIGLMYEHLNAPVPKIEPSEVDYFHSRLNDLICRGMSKDPEQRFGSMQEMANQIEEIISLLRDARQSSRPFAQMWIIASVLSLCAVVLCGTIFISKRAKPQMQVQESFEAFKAAESRRKQREDNLERVFKNSLGEHLNNLIRLYEDQQRWAQAEPLIKQDLTNKKKLFGPDDPQVAESLGRLGTCNMMQGKYKEAELLLQRALAIDSKSLGPDHQEIAYRLQVLGDCWRRQGKYTEAVQAFKRSLAIREKTLSADHPWNANSISGLAFCYFDQGKYAEAEPLFKRSLAIREKALGQGESFEPLHDLDDLAVCFQREGKYAEAEPLLKQALAIREKLLGPYHPSVVLSLEKLANFYFDQGKYSDAEPLFKRVIAMQEKALEPQPNIAYSLNRLAECYEHQGNHTEAAPLQKRARAIQSKTTP